MSKKMIEVGNRIKEQRNKADMTQKSLADKIKKTESSISAYEKGKVEIPHNVLEKIADALGTSVIYLQYGETPADHIGRLFYEASELEEQYLARMKQSRADAEAADALYQAYGFSFRLDGDNWIVTAPDGKESVFNRQERTEYGTITVRELKEYALYLHHKAVKAVLGEE